MSPPSEIPARITKVSAHAGGLAAAALAAVPVALLFGFTVDDALITARVADHLALGHGARFNTAGAVVDAVTPLGYAHLLALAGGHGPLRVLAVAKLVGALAWLAAAALVGIRVAAEGRSWRRFTALSLLLACAPLAAWSVSGMETGIVTALAAVACTTPRLRALCAGLAAAWRPELVPWAVVLSVGAVWLGSSREVAPATDADRATAVACARTLAVVLAPAVAVAAVRFATFGTVMPLAVLAKPPDGTLGVTYALGALLFTGPPWLVATWAALRGLPAGARATLAAAAVHFVAIAAAGGDWMPLSRLAVPVLPGLIWVGALVADRAAPWATYVRVGLGLVASVQMAWRVGPDAREVGQRREALVVDTRDALRGCARVATVDAGWVGAATAATVVDLAGVTDPAVAALGGSHTSKRLDPGFVERRRVDCAVVLCRSATSTTCDGDREVEARVLAQMGAFTRTQRVALLGTTKAYDVLWRPAEPP